MKVLLDTNICIYIIKQKPPQALQKFLTFAVGDVGVSAVTTSELMYGAQKSQRPHQNQQAIEQFLLPLVVVAFDFEASTVYGGIRAELERQGTPIGAMDLLIAAHALHLGIPLVTNNTKEFSRVPGLSMENWA